MHRQVDLQSANDEENTALARLQAALKELTPASIEKLRKEAEGLCAKQSFQAISPPVIVGQICDTIPDRPGHTSSIYSRMINASSSEQSRGGPTTAWAPRTATVDAEEQPYDDQIRRLISRVNQRRSLTAGLLSMWEEQWTNETESRDPAGERVIKQLGMALRRKSIEFTDPDFPPSSTSLFRNPNDRGPVTGTGTFRKVFHTG